MMMKYFKRPLKKIFNKGKLKEYQISLGVNSDIDDNRFYQNEKGRMICDVIICFPDEFEKMKNEHEKFQSQMQSLKDEINEKKKTIEKLQNQLSSIDEDNKKKIKELDDKYSDKVKQLNKDLHEKDLEIEKTKTDYEVKIGNLKEKYQGQIGDLKEKTQKDLNDLELFDGDKHMLIKDHDEEVSKLSIFNPEYHMKKEDHQKELNRMRGNCLKLRVRENKKYSSYIDELDNLGRLDKFLNKDKKLLKEMKSFNKSSIDEKAIDVNFNLINKGE